MKIKSNRNLKFIAIVLFVTACFSDVIAQKKQKASANPKISLQDVWFSGKFSARGVNGLRSMKDGKHYTSFARNPKTGAISVVMYQYADSKPIDTLLSPILLTPKDSLKPLSLEDFEFNADESYILIKTNIEPIYRRSTKENTWLFNRTTKSLRPLSVNGMQSFATFSPDGKMVAFVRNNNLFITNLKNNTESQITFDGKWNEIINGSSDWVYEEEFEITKCFFWSPDSKKLAFLRFDERAVKEFVMPIYDQLYPTNFSFKYPKAGEENASVTAFVYHLTNGKTIPVETQTNAGNYLPRMGFTPNDNELWFYNMNRHQNTLKMYYADATTGKSTLVYEETNKAWIDIHDHLTFINKGGSFIMSNEKSGFLHLYHYQADGKLKNQITQGNWEVTAFHGFDEKNNYLYYTSTEESSLERHVYRIKLDGTGKEKLSTQKGKNVPAFSSDMSYYINTHSDANNPFTVTLHSSDGKQLRVLENNQRTREAMSQLKLAKKAFLTIPGADGTPLNAWIMKPADFSPKKKYPVFMFVYGGPGSVQVEDSWGGANYWWYQYLCQEGYVVVCVDNRGTGGRGEAFKKVTYMQLGKYETEDQIAAAKYLSNLSFVDGKRLGIMGWSYGGYMSSLCITKGADIFKLAVAVAPVINWRFYDTIYTERYMRTPQENANGYDDNSPQSHAEKLKGKYLLIHGTADDNVHFQNAMVMAAELVKANKQFDFMAYPDKDHGIYGGATRLQLFTKITDFIKTNL